MGREGGDLQWKPCGQGWELSLPDAQAGRGDPTTLHSALPGQNHSLALGPLWLRYKAAEQGHPGGFVVFPYPQGSWGAYSFNATLFNTDIRGTVSL